MNVDFLIPTSRLSFHEANILIENMRENQDQAAFISRLDTLSLNTSDPILIGELENLIYKVGKLTPTEFQQLCSLTRTGSVVFPQDCPLPYPTIEI